MKPTPSVPLLEELRARTSERHRQLDSSAFTRALSSGTLTLDAYRGMLHATFIVRDALERALEAQTDPAITSVWSPAFKRAPLLESDLSYLERTGAPARPAAIQAARDVAEQGRVRADRDPVSLLGWLYVMEGSMKGAPVVSRLARRTFGFGGDDGLTYLSSGENEAADTWENFSSRMNAL
jgi:heme oxygenase